MKASLNQIISSVFGYLVKRLDDHESRDRKREAIKGRRSIERSSVGG